jgi:pyrroline-5-carboxylate reductase
MTPFSSGQVKGVILGLGNLASAIVSGALEAGVLTPEQLTGLCHSQASAEKRSAQLGFPVYSQASFPSQLLAEADFVLLGLKPYQLPKVLPGLLAQGLKPDGLVISIAAGAKLDQLTGWLGRSEQPTLRAMTNTPAQAKAACTALCANAGVTPEQHAWAMQLFSSVGLAIDLPESQFDPFTALAGSGPAFVLTLIEAFQDGGVEAGLPRKAVQAIVPQLLKGTVALLEHRAQHPAQLRDEVTTPAGTTAAGLAALEAGAVRSDIANAVQAATQRCKALT